MPFIDTPDGRMYITGARQAAQAQERGNAKGVVVWDGEGEEPARPEGYPSVEWVSPVEPETNMVDGDTWVFPT